MTQVSLEKKQHVSDLVRARLFIREMLKEVGPEKMETVLNRMPGFPPHCTRRSITVVCLLICPKMNLNGELMVYLMSFLCRWRTRLLLGLKVPPLITIYLQHRLLVMEGGGGREGS